MAKAAEGKVVKADFGGGEEYALLVQHGADKDAQGSGRTWWNA